jgi:hypothetical protein
LKDKKEFVMEMQKFESKTAMLEFLKGLKAKDHYRIAKDHGFRPRNHSEAWLLTDYLVQGANSGLTGEALQAYAKEKSERLVAIMPHLARDPNGVAPDAEPVPVEFQLAPIPTSDAPTETAQDATVTPAPKVVKAPKQPKAPKASKPRGAKHADFTIVPRPDRGGWEVWVGGRAEAFRPTVEKCIAFVNKKYPGNETKLLD